MERIVECVPNISEGRRKEVVEAVVNEVRSTANVTLLDYSSDESQPDVGRKAHDDHADAPRSRTAL